MYILVFFFFNDTATTEIYTLSSRRSSDLRKTCVWKSVCVGELLYTLKLLRSEEHTSELQSRLHLVCRLLLEKKMTKRQQRPAGSGGRVVVCAGLPEPRH